MMYVKIELSEKDAQLFKVFQRYYDKIDYLLSCGVFEIINGSCEIHFDAKGAIRDVIKSSHYRHKYNKTLDSDFG